MDSLNPGFPSFRTDSNRSSLAHFALGAFALTIPSGTTSSSSNGLNQIATVGGSGSAHDARGNLTSDPTSGKTFGYSSENLLTSASGGVTLAYDPLMRLYQTTGAVTTRFGYDSTALIAEYDGSNAQLRRYVHGPSTDEPLVQYEGSGLTDRRFMHADERGSVIAISDGSGNALTTNRYDEFGKPQSTNAGRFQYTGQTWLPEAGLYYYKARMYAPHLGRFVQVDPAWPFAAMNSYGYASDDPLNRSDPDGLEDKPAPGGPKPPGDTDENEIIVVGRKTAATIIVVAQQPSDWVKYGIGVINYGVQQPSYVLGVTLSSLGVSKPPKPPVLPKPPIITTGTLDNKAAQINQWYSEQRGNITSTRMQIYSAVGHAIDIFGKVFGKH